MKQAFKFCLIIFLTLLTASCAMKPTDPDELAVYEQNDDPLEPLNRGIFAFNMAADKLVIKPLAQGYRAVLPKPARTGISNFFANLRQPMYFVNALLQGEGGQSVDIFKRFMANTFWGVFGLFDVASELEVPKNDNDFGQTLAVWGWERSGPFLVLPFLGPSNPRDAIGVGADAFLAPIDWILADHKFLLYSRLALENWSKREQALDFLDNLEKSSTDFYATMRSMYRQNRNDKIAKSTGQTLGEGDKPAYDVDFDIYDEEE